MNFRKIAGAFRVVGGRDSVESDLSKELSKRNRYLEDYFDFKSLKLVELKKKGSDSESDSCSEDEECVNLNNNYHYVHKTGVFCTNVDELVMDVLNHRELDPSSVDIHVGLDGGQSSLKIGLTITAREESSNTAGRSHYSDGIAPQDAKFSSVKKLLLLAVVVNASENHSNVQAMLSLLNIESIEFSASCDVKMLNILTGKSGGNPKYGCPFCNACSPYLENGVLYCLSDLLALNKAYVDSGSNKKKQKDFQNFTNTPLLTGDPEQLVLGLLAVPELHLLIGVTDKIMKGFEDSALPTPSLGRKFMDRFLKKVAIVRKSYQGCHLVSKQLF